MVCLERHWIPAFAGMMFALFAYQIADYCCGYDPSVKVLW
jgi:hypothetical protein